MDQNNEKQLSLNCAKLRSIRLRSGVVNGLENFNINYQFCNEKSRILMATLAKNISHSPNLIFGAGGGEGLRDGMDSGICILTYSVDLKCLVGS